MALAAALSFAARNMRAGTRAVLPAYSCPDIVSAVMFAGLHPAFVDLAPNRTSAGVDTITAAINSCSRVIVIADLFGCDADPAPLRETAAQFGTLLVHDRAQSLAGPGLDSPPDDEFAVISLGRGKPVTLLGGGATWSRPDREFSQFCEERFPVCPWDRTSTVIRSALYNLALAPPVFRVASLNPSLAIGQTVLKPLRAVVRLPDDWLRYAADQIRHRSCQEPERRSRTQALCDAILSAGYRIPADALETADRKGLNRVPVLCQDPGQVQQLLARGTHLGLSSMYGYTLPEILGEPESRAQALYPNAYELSRTLVTAPTHSRISPAARNRLIEVFRSAR